MRPIHNHHHHQHHLHHHKQSGDNISKTMAKTTATTADSPYNFAMGPLYMSITQFAIICITGLVAVLVICFFVYIIIQLQCKKKVLRALDKVIYDLKGLDNTRKILETPMDMILSLCEANGILAPAVLREYEQDRMQRRAVVYASLGVTDYFATPQPTKREELAYYKRLADEFLDWDQNVYLRNGREGEEQLIDKYGINSKTKTGNEPML